MKWIPVQIGRSLNMPQVGEKCLVRQCPNATMTKNALFAKWSGEKFDVIDEHDNRKGNSAWSEITHWMPLPSTDIDVNERYWMVSIDCRNSKKVGTSEVGVTTNNGMHFNKQKVVEQLEKRENCEFAIKDMLITNWIEFDSKEEYEQYWKKDSD